MAGLLFGIFDFKQGKRYTYAKNSKSGRSGDLITQRRQDMILPEVYVENTGFYLQAVVIFMSMAV